MRDPATRNNSVLTAKDGIPIVKGYIEFYAKKLKEAKEDKSMREALKGLEESMQIFKLVLTLKNQPGN